MPTDRDRFARRLDERFRKVAFLIESGSPDAVVGSCTHVLVREREADPKIAAFFVDVHRVLTAPAITMLRDENPDNARINRRSAESEPALRLKYAYDDVQNGAHADLATASAARCIGWVEGQIATVPAWAHLRERFAAIKEEATRELTAMTRKRYLGIGDAPPPRVTARTQAELASQMIPVA